MEHTGQMDLLTSDTARHSRLRQAVLDALRSGPKTNIQLNAVCYRYGARIHELRRDGLHIITKDYVSPGIFVYTLKESQ